MKSKSRKSCAAVATVLFLVLSLAAAAAVFARNPEPPGPAEHLSGPAVVGTLTAIKGEGDTVESATFSGQCMGVQFQLDVLFLFDTFTNVTEERLTDYPLPHDMIYSLPDGCAPPPNKYVIFPIVDTVSRFSVETCSVGGTVRACKRAELVVLFYVNN